MTTVIEKFESQIAEHAFAVSLKDADPSHDHLHLKRVVGWARKLAILENAKLDVVIPAAYLHDIVNLPKDHSDRKLASVESAREATRFLRNIHYPTEFISEITHAIEAHSFSGGIAPTTIEAKIVQDADRLDALGAIGAARCFCISGRLSRPFYSEADPLALHREPDDRSNTLDHFFVKLYGLQESLNTRSAQVEGTRRVEFLKAFAEQLASEI
ncbi:MAG: HD domain-containing protein [Bdellovibrionota bacterium]